MDARDQRTADRPVLESARLMLRRPDAGDIQAIIAIVGDWEVVRRLARVPHPYEERDARYFLDRIVPNEWVWAITLRPAGELVGMVGLTPETDPDTAELGYYVGRPYWRRGIATEAARMVVDYGLNRLGLRRLTSGHFADNPASGRVLAKLGFVHTRYAERPCLALGASIRSVEVHLEA